MKTSSWVSISALALAATLAGCSADSQADTDSRLDVRAEVYAFTWVAEQVGGDRVAVTQMIPTGADVHHYEISPRELTELGVADLVVTSNGVATAVDEAIEEAAPAHLVDATEHIDLLWLTPLEEGHSEDDGHDHGDFDSHTWLAIEQMPAVVAAIADALTEIDPAGAEEYAANAQAVTHTLTALADDYRTGLATCERESVIVTHPAFGYITDAYDLEQVGISGFDEDTEPSPARLAEIGDVAEESDSTTIFMADTSNPKVADVLASELGLDTAVLYTLTGALDGKDYVSLAEDNLTALRTALGCQ